MKLFFTRRSIRQLTQIEDYHRENKRTSKGKQVVRQIRDRAKELETNPELGPVERNLEELKQGHRSLLVGTIYKIVYLLAKPLIIITDIFDVRQDPDEMRP